MEKGNYCFLPACPHYLCRVHYFTGIRAYFLGILMYIKDQLRHPASRTEQLQDFWTFGYETAIVGLVRPQSVSLYLYLMII